MLDRQDQPTKGHATEQFFSVLPGLANSRTALELDNARKPRSVVTLYNLTPVPALKNVVGLHENTESGVASGDLYGRHLLCGPRERSGHTGIAR